MRCLLLWKILSKIMVVETKIQILSTSKATPISRTSTNLTNSFPKIDRFKFLVTWLLGSESGEARGLPTKIYAQKGWMKSWKSRSSEKVDSRWVSPLAASIHHWQASSLFTRSMFALLIHDSSNEKFLLFLDRLAHPSSQSRDPTMTSSGAR